MQSDTPSSDARVHGLDAQQDEIHNNQTDDAVGKHSCTHPNTLCALSIPKSYSLGRIQAAQTSVTMRPYIEQALSLANHAVVVKKHKDESERMNTDDIKST